MKSAARHAATIALLIAACMSPSFADTPGPAEIVEHQTGARFPALVRIEDGAEEYRLLPTGMAVRRKFVFDVYSLAHYLQSEPATPRSELLHRILSDDTAKEAIMVFARDLRAGQIRDGMLDAYKANASGTEYAATAAVLDRFLGSIRKDVSRGERFVVRWLPGGRFQALHAGRRVFEVRDPVFARLYWSVWFGDRPTVDRDRLMAGWGS
ncbi:MAG: chalcone isomerase family protein [Gammaproteobacteria bacterium]